MREKRVYNWGNLTDVNVEIILEKLMKLNQYKAFGGTEFVI